MLFKLRIDASDLATGRAAAGIIGELVAPEPLAVLRLPEVWAANAPKPVPAFAVPVVEKLPALPTNTF